MLPHKLDTLRLPTWELLARRHLLASRLGEPEHVLLGSLVEQTRRCGKIDCRCASGAGHGPYTYLTPRRGGPGMRYVPAALVTSVRSCLVNGQHAEMVLAEISAINVELLARRALG